MFHGLDNQFLYSAYKITATFADDIGNVKSGTGTCFFVKNKSGNFCLITNRHVVDLSYKKDDASLSKYSIREIKISGKSARIGDNFPESDLSFEVDPNIEVSTDYQNDVACITELSLLSGVNVRLDYWIPYSFLASESDFQLNLTVLAD
ncbi:MAG: hypothetical protein KME10_25510 [Plectolyngbya sp. WJT66-NPBG17]|jgi:hypothetical protein|nr:hypothetical protein [Plectolyngbya sp. WJT66-NPBG17]